MVPGPGTIEVRPPRAVVLAVGAVAVVTAVLSVVALAAGDVLVGGAALVASAWVLSVVALAAGAVSRADADGVEVRWMRRRVAVPWTAFARVEVEHLGGSRALPAVVLVGRDGGTLRWTPWFPFLWFARRPVRDSTDGLIRLAAAAAVPVDDPEGGAGDDRDDRRGSAEN